MTLIQKGLNRIRDLIYDDIDIGQLGTGGTASTESDTDLETPDATTELTLVTKTKSNKSIKFDYTLPSTGGTTGTYKEYKLSDSYSLFCYDRIVFTGISFTKDGTKDLKISKSYYLRRV
jgi:hypothetical protein